MLIVTGAVYFIYIITPSSPGIYVPHFIYIYDAYIFDIYAEQKYI